VSRTIHVRLSVEPLLRYRVGPSRILALLTVFDRKESMTQLRNWSIRTYNVELNKETHLGHGGHLRGDSETEHAMMLSVPT